MDDDDGFRTTPPPPPPQQNPLLTFARDNLALLIPIVGALMFAFRCVIVSDGDLYVASILIVETSIGDAIRALLFTAVPPLSLIVAYVSAFAVSRQIEKDRWRNRETLGFLLLSPLAAFTAFYLTPGPSLVGWPRTVLYSISPLLLFLMLSIMRVYANRKIIRQVIILIVLALMVIVTAQAFAGRTFWLPREHLSFHGEDPFTGYVLRESEDRLVILNDGPRVIIQKDKDALEERDFCYPEDHKARSSKVAVDAPVCP